MLVRFHHRLHHRDERQRTLREPQPGGLFVPRRRELPARRRRQGFPGPMDGHARRDVGKNRTHGRKDAHHHGRRQRHRCRTEYHHNHRSGPGFAADSGEPTSARQRIRPLPQARNFPDGRGHVAERKVHGRIHRVHRTGRFVAVLADHRRHRNGRSL